MDESKDGDKTDFICPSFDIPKRLPDKSKLFTAEPEAIVFALRYIKSTTNGNKFVIFSESKSVLQSLLRVAVEGSVTGIIPLFKLL